MNGAMPVCCSKTWSTAWHYRRLSHSTLQRVRLRRVRFRNIAMWRRGHILCSNSLTNMHFKWGVDATSEKCGIEVLRSCILIIGDDPPDRLYPSHLYPSRPNTLKRIPSHSQHYSPMSTSSQKSIRFFSRVYNLRILEHIPQGELAKELGIGRKALANIEKGISQPSLFTAFRIAQYFRTSVEKIFSFK